MAFEFKVSRQSRTYDALVPIPMIVIHSYPLRLKADVQNDEKLLGPCGTNAAKMQRWTPVSDQKRHGIAIQHFRQVGQSRIKLIIGDRVNVYEENGDWYFGCLAVNENILGIFPKAYIRLTRRTDLLERHKHKDGLESNLCSGIFNEIVPVLKEWNPVWKQLYLRRDKNVSKIKDVMCELIIYHKKILYGRLTKHLMSELKSLIASLIDVGNRMLGLDLVARDEEGNRLAGETTSAMKLFSGHELASSRQSLVNLSLPSMKTLKEDKKHHSYDLLVSFMNFICIAEGDLELVLTLYDALGDCPVSDNYVFFWKPNSSQEEAAVLRQSKVLYTDLVQEDIKRKQIYLVCYAMRIDSVEQRRAEIVDSLANQATALSDVKSVNKKSKVKCKRRPYGVAAVDVSSYLGICAEERAGEDHIFLPFLRYSRGSMRCLLNHIISMKKAALDDCGGCGLWFKLKLFNRDPTEALRLSHVSMEDVIEIQKIGFPEVIMPANMRNEFFLTLIGGEFSRFLSPEKNVEVAVSIRGEDGRSVPGVIQMGDDVLTEYRSLIYYRESKPEWHETMKINMPISGFRGCHLKFTFTHRSAIFGAERPFGISFINMMKECGTLIQDGKHVLNVFMIDHKKFEEDSCPYLGLRAKSVDEDVKRYNAKGLKLSEKCRFVIQTYVCSTKLTQNVSLLRLLDWRRGNYMLLETLGVFLKVDGSEIIKFLPDILDALFAILEEPFELTVYGVTIFDCLVYVLNTLSDEKYEHFLPVLKLYMEERFNSPHVYMKLIAILNLRLIDRSLPIASRVKILKSLNHYGSFILKSRKLCEKIQEMEDAEDFIVAMKDLINSVVNVCHSETLDRKTQGNCLKYCYPLIFMIEDTLQSKELAVEWCKQCCKLKNFIKSFGIVNARDNIIMINEIVESKIFLLPKWRLILTPVLLEKLMEYLNANTEVELCINGLNGVLEPLQPPQFDEREIQNHTRSTSGLMLSLLENLLEAIKRLTRRSLVTGKLLALVIEILRQIAIDTFQCYQNYFSTDEELLFFIMALLIFFKEMLSRPFFPSDWLEMIMLQNSAILRTLKCVACTIKDKFLEPINKQIWINYFHLAVTFITQSSLQLENFSENKSSKILLCYMDMRLEVASSIKDMWLTLGEHQRALTPHLVEQLLEVALIPNAALRQVIIPVFFDMARCEFFSSSNGDESNSHSSVSRMWKKSNFSEFEAAIVSAFDMLVNAGKGDDLFKDQLCSILEALFKQSEPMKIQGLRFVSGMREQLESLLECRRNMKEGCSENVMICLFQLLDLYRRRNYQELYVRYVSKLCDWHIKYSNYAEAAKTVNLHAQLLDWSHDAVPASLSCSHYPKVKTCFELKEILYNNIIQYFDLGRMWLCAIDFCQHLIDVYENRVYDYSKLAGILRKKSSFYEKIRTERLPEVEYFYVSFSGPGFPTFYQNKTFVFRGNYFEDYQSFCSRVKNQFPEAQVVKGWQGQAGGQSSHQYIEIIKIYPTFDETDQYSASHIQEAIVYHLHEYNVQKFRFSSFKHNWRCTLYDEQYVSGTEAEAAGFTLTASEETKTLPNLNCRTVVVTSHSFPWCLKISPVTSVSTYDVTSLWNAIEEVHAINRSLFGLLPSEVYDYQTTKYVHSKLKELMDSSYAKRLNQGIKALVKENREKLAQLGKLVCLLDKQIELIRDLCECFDSLDSQRKLLHYLNKCREKLTSSIGSSVRKKSLNSSKSSEAIPATANQLAGETQPIVKKVSFKEKKKQSLSPRSAKFFTLFKDGNIPRDHNASWYVPTPSSEQDESSSASRHEVSLRNAKSVFHFPTPAPSLAPSLSDASFPLAKGLPLESSMDSLSSSSNAEVNSRKSFLSNNCSLEDLLLNIDFKFQGNKLSAPSKQETPSSPPAVSVIGARVRRNLVRRQTGNELNNGFKEEENAVESSTCCRQSSDEIFQTAADPDVPPPLPPKARSYPKSSPPMVCVKGGGGGILKKQGFDYVNIPGDDENLRMPAKN